MAENMQKHENERNKGTTTEEPKGNNWEKTKGNIGKKENIDKP